MPEMLPPISAKDVARVEKTLESSSKKYLPSIYQSFKSGLAEFAFIKRELPDTVDIFQNIRGFKKLNKEEIQKISEKTIPKFESILGEFLKRKLTSICKFVKPAVVDLKELAQLVGIIGLFVSAIGYCFSRVKEKKLNRAQITQNLLSSWLDCFYTLENMVIIKSKNEFIANLLECEKQQKITTCMHITSHENAEQELLDSIKAYNEQRALYFQNMIRLHQATNDYLTREDLDDSYLNESVKQIDREFSLIEVGVKATLIRLGSRIVETEEDIYKDSEKKGEKIKTNENPIEEAIADLESTEPIEYRNYPSYLRHPSCSEFSADFFCAEQKQASVPKAGTSPLKPSTTVSVSGRPPVAASIEPCRPVSQPASVAVLTPAYSSAKSNGTDAGVNSSTLGPSGAISVAVPHPAFQAFSSAVTRSSAYPPTVNNAISVSVTGAPSKDISSDLSPLPLPLSLLACASPRPGR